jgi:AcrR family transcriptional regulator
MPGRKAPEEQRREEILRAAYRVAARERLAGLTGRAVAAEAGVSSGLVFFHFGDRDGLLVALLEWLLEVTVVGPELHADGLSAVVAGFIEGCALQVVMDPAGFDVNAYMRTVQTLVSDPLALRLAAARHVRG